MTVELAAGTTLFVGVLLLAIGAAMALWYVRDSDYQTRKLLLSSRPTNLRGAMPRTEVRITGRAMQGPEGVLTTVMTGRPALLYRSTALQRVSPDGTTYRHVHREGAQTSFLLDDGSGPPALVRADNYTLVLRVRFEARDPFTTPALKQWLMSRVGRLPSRMKFEEKWIPDGHEITVIGTVSRTTTPDGRDVVLLTDSPSKPLFITDYEPAEAARELHSNVPWGVGFAVAGAVVIVAGIVLGVLAS